MSRKKLKDPILNQPIREAVLKRIACGEIAWADVSKRSNDTTRVQRQLGIKPETSGGITDQIEYQEAVRIVRAAGLDPVDVGV